MLGEIVGLPKAQLISILSSLGEPPYRARQIFRSVYSRQIDDFREMTELKQPLRDRLSRALTITFPRIARKTAALDGTLKYLFELIDGETIESVYIPDDRRITLCLSTQVGCSFRCRFCLTATLGFKRNLTAGEIVGQALAIVRDHGGRAGRRSLPMSRLNLVLMGMGEPLLNYENTMEAIRLLADEEGMAISPKRITLSTAGVVPRIADLAKEKVRPHLAISLTATTETLRTQLMPHNRKYTLAGLMEACRAYPLSPRERLTFEYVLLRGLNDSDEDAHRLVRLLRGLRAKVNLIALNEASELPYRASSPERVLAFQKILIEHHLSAFLRKPRGLDILAACGQLKRLTEDSALAHAIA